jgi:hypothetical protein
MARQSGGAPVDQGGASTRTRDVGKGTEPSQDDRDEGAGNSAGAGEAIDLDTVRDRAS